MKIIKSLPFSFLIVGMLLSCGVPSLLRAAEHEAAPVDHGVVVITMDMAILPGAQQLLERALRDADVNGARAVLVYLDTPGGVLTTAQEMAQLMLRSKIPVIVYVAPQGSSATSAGAFITMAAHIAAMAPGTTIGAAHPVASDGKDISGDMRAKVENFTASMAKAIAESRGRNTAWAEKAVKESVSVTEQEALDLKVIDVVASSEEELFQKIRGRKVKAGDDSIVIPDLTALPRRHLEINFKERALNFFADPNVAALLWLAATTGISIELYNPGAVLPGVVGVICLILALLVSQVIPVSAGAVALIVAGAIMIGAELYVTSGVLGIGGVIAIALGSIYLIDVTEAPGLAVSPEMVLPSAIMVGILLLVVAITVAKSARRRASTGKEGMKGLRGVALENLAPSGRVFVNGEIWNAVAVRGLIAKDSAIEVSSLKDGLVLEVQPVPPQVDNNSK